MSSRPDPPAPRRVPRHRAGGRGWVVLAATLSPFVLVGVWAAIAGAEFVAVDRVPSPGSVAFALADLAVHGLAGQITITVLRVLLGFACATAAGLALGAVAGLSRNAGVVMAPVIAILRAMPSVAWLPLLVLGLGIGDTAIVTLIAIGAAFPVFSAAADSVRRVDNRPMRIAGGLRRGVRLAWLLVITAEMLGSSRGMGALLNDAANSGRTARVVALLILIGALGAVTDALFAAAERRFAHRAIRGSCRADRRARTRT